MKSIEVLHKDAIKATLDAYLNQNAESRYIRRLQIINYIMENEDVSCNAAAKIFNVSPKAVQNWVNKINITKDIETLRDQPGKGRKTRLTQAQLTKIGKVVKRTPGKVGLNAKQWNGTLLSKYITQNLGVDLKIRQCQRLLKNYGVEGPTGRPANQGAE